MPVLKSLGGFIKGLCASRIVSVALSLAVISAALVLPSTASAQLTDPSTLHVTNGITDPGTDPNPIGGSGALTILQQSGGGPAGNLNPVLLIIGIPNDPTGASHNFYGNNTSKGFSNPISSVTYSSGGTATAALGGTNLFGGSWDVHTGYGATMTSSTDDAYTLLGYGGANNSNSFVNWAGGETKFKTGVTAAGFSLYVFTLTDAKGLSDSGTISVQFKSGELPVGSYAVAFSANTQHIFDTPFTESGLEQPVPTPEFGSGVLMSLMLVGFVGFGRLRYFRRVPRACAA